jgi:hypothetical protein
MKLYIQCVVVAWLHQQHQESQKHSHANLFYGSLIKYLKGLISESTELFM